WDESATPFLPEYMKKFYRALLKTFKEFEIHVEDDGQNRIDHTKKAFQKLSAYYLQEAEWSYQYYKPSFEEQVA
uniref:Terpene synthase metal-binding domain-containing protein n=1 Tax=Oryza glaberrima TaxID=4538 RepID=I1PK96_ORYGL